MAKRRELRDEDELCLPPHLLSDGSFLEEARSKLAAAAFHVLEEMAGDKDCVAALAWHLAHAGPHSSMETRSGPCHVSSPFLRFLEERRDDLLREAAAQVVRLRLRHAGHFQDIYDRRLLAPPKKPSTRPPLPVVTNNARGVLTAQQQMWAAQGKARGSRTLGQWPQQQHPVRPGNGMKAVFLSSSVAKRASTGTGVFLPRTHGSKPEPRKTSVCSTMPVPARASHALNLTLEELGSQPRFAGKNDRGGDSQRNAMVSLQKSESELVLQPTSIVSRDTHLPHEWTY